ncbi:hypothetical protein BDV25DRAFT_165975 [Aspergillus avenaceus]|uniref:Chromatin modification-related protein n=1 Tax=Aspergillus avenaceus TaxID=36643 RepID=A0A5N6TF10_ASPAV|nr:hypothetical protein BDV25DRAFT_165975 [Aspergillus avenaceus]
MTSTVPSSAVNSRQSARQTRTNPSRTSKTLGRSSFAYGHSSMADTPPTPPVAHGFYPALTHFTDAITALPREFRRHNSLLKEVDAKAWALEDNLVQLLKTSSELQASPSSNPAPNNVGASQEDLLARGISQAPDSQDSTNRRIMLGRVRQTLQDLMMTADEKNHVISNANDELDRQLLRLDTIFPFIAGEISEEARLGSLTHWAYSNRNAVKTATNERPRREAASNKDLAHALQEAEAASRSEARREAVMARKQRRTNADGDFEDGRTGSRKGQSSKSRGAANDASAVGHAQGGGSGPTKRRKVERPPPVDTATTMERSASGAGSSGRAASKDAPDATKKRSRAPNANSAAARKRNNAAASVADSPVLAPSPLVGAAVIPRSAASPGPSATTRPQSSRVQQNSGPATNGRQRPSSSASNRVSNNNKTGDTRATPKETPKLETVPLPNPETQQEMEGEAAEPTAPKTAVPASAKREDTDGKPTQSIEPGEAPAPPASNPAPKGRSSKTSTPVLATFTETTQRVRPTRSTDTAPAKRSHKKNGGAPVVQQRAASEEEESYHEGDDEDEEGEPRYCYCNEISFGEMVACDNDACPREWFHLSCVGLTKPPGKNVKWYCNECKENMRRSRSGR